MIYLGMLVFAVPGIDDLLVGACIAVPGIDDFSGVLAFAVPPIKDLLNINYNILYERIICHDLFNQLLILLKRCYHVKFC